MNRLNYMMGLVLITLMAATVIIRNPVTREKMTAFGQPVGVAQANVEDGMIRQDPFYACGTGSDLSVCDEDNAAGAKLYFLQRKSSEEMWSLVNYQDGTVVKTMTEDEYAGTQAHPGPLSTLQGQATAKPGKESFGYDHGFRFRNLTAGNISVTSRGDGTLLTWVRIGSGPAHLFFGGQAIIAPSGDMIYLSERHLVPGHSGTGTFLVAYSLVTDQPLGRWANPAQLALHPYLHQFAYCEPATNTLVAANLDKKFGLS